jgi:hypothetical protein
MEYLYRRTSKSKCFHTAIDKKQRGRKRDGAYVVSAPNLVNPRLLAGVAAAVGAGRPWHVHPACLRGRKP